jgi:hypothetical protein
MLHPDALIAKLRVDIEVLSELGTPQVGRPLAEDIRLLISAFATVTHERDSAIRERDRALADVERLKQAIDERIGRGNVIKQLCDQIYPLTIHGDPPAPVVERYQAEHRTEDK